MTNISKKSEKERELLAQNTEVKIGQLFLEERGEYLLKVSEVYLPKERYSELYVSYDRSEDGGKTWRSYSSGQSISEFLRRFKNSFIDNYDEWKREVQAVISGEKTIDDYRDVQEISEETALMHVKSKEYLLALQQSMEEKRKKAQIIAKGVQFEMERQKRELDKLRHSLEAVVAEFREKVQKIEKVIWTIELYLGINENIVQIQSGPGASSADPIHFWQNTLFMDEEVGDPMDDLKGLDFENIQDFDSWLLKYSDFYKKYNYELLIPQEKGLICLRVRREDKEYYSNGNPFLDSFRNSQLNQENKKTYILIRNGQNIYRIWGDITIHPKLFPDRSELNDLKEKWDFIDDQENKKDTTWIGDSKYGYISDTKSAKEKINEQLFRYKQYFIMLQGLIDRTEIFYPIPEKISLMSEECHDKGLVKFIYEDDLRLTDGKLSFYEWQKEVNSTIDEGSRILFIDNVSNRGKDHVESYMRYDQRYHQGQYYGGKTHYNLPDRPNSGIFQVKNYVTKVTEKITAVANNKSELPEYAFEGWIDGYFDDPSRFPFVYAIRDEKGYHKYHEVTKKYPSIYYNPGGTVYNLWDYNDYGHGRKNSVSYKIFPDNDTNILNYDNIDLKDVEYYLHERRHRRNYLQMIPILWEIKKKREEEILKETEFVKGLVEDMKRNQQKIENPKQTIWEAIEWFKTKNKWKRPLTENDELAWRMIKKKLGLKTE